MKNKTKNLAERREKEERQYRPVLNELIYRIDRKALAEKYPNGLSLNDFVKKQ